MDDMVMWRWWVVMAVVVDGDGRWMMVAMSVVLWWRR